MRVAVIVVVISKAKEASRQSAPRVVVNRSLIYKDSQLICAMSNASSIGSAMSNAWSPEHK